MTKPPLKFEIIHENVINQLKDFYFFIFLRERARLFIKPSSDIDPVYEPGHWVISSTTELSIES